MNPRWSKYFLVFAIILFGFIGNIFAADGADFQGKTLIQIFSDGLSGTFGTDWWISLMVFVLIVLILYSVLAEIEFFGEREWLEWAVAFLLAAIATSVQSVMIGVVGLMTSYGVGMSIGVFFAALFILGLSKFYRKKAEQFDFLMGDQFLTILIVHMPLIFMFALIGGILGGLGTDGSLTGVINSGVPIGGWVIPAVAIIAILTLGIIFFVFKKGRQSLKKSTIGRWVLLAILLLLLLFGSGVPVFGGNGHVLDAKTISQIWGAIIGAILGLGFALLERGRHLQETTSAIEAYSTIMTHAQEQIEPLMRDVMRIEERMTKSSAYDANDRTKMYIKQELGENIKAGKTIDDLKAIIKLKQESIDDLKMKSGFDAKKAADAAKKSIWTSEESSAV